jgi:hypothetical protein
MIIKILSHNTNTYAFSSRRQGTTGDDAFFSNKGTLILCFSRGGSTQPLAFNTTHPIYTHCNKNIPLYVLQIFVSSAYSTLTKVH